MTSDERDRLRNANDAARFLRGEQAKLETLVKSLKQRNEELSDALRNPDVEWCWNGVSRCPWCKQRREDGHTNGCARQRALRG